MSQLEKLLPLLRCPKTGGPLQLHAEEAVLATSQQEEIYPLINGVPWLLPNPRNSLMDWSAKLNHFNQVLLSEIQSIEKELKHAQGATELRLKKLLEGKQQFIKRVSELFFPVVRAQASTKNVYDALRDRAPSQQSLLSYEANLYRDWVWGEEENTLTHDIVAAHFQGEVGKLCVIGAGAGRLALDLHASQNPELTLATDINPLLVMAAEYLLTGKNLPFVEFPLHPRTSEFVAVEHEIKGQAKPENFHFVFADATKPCFTTAAFNTVVTPWFIDIQPLEFSKFLRQLNQYIPIGGLWVNFGSLVFNQKRDALCYSVEEVKGIALQQGFEIAELQEHEIPYLKSPYNAGYRMERVWSWSAKKIADVKALNQPQVMPAWLLDQNQAVPKAQYFQQFSFKHRAYAQLTAEVDGKTSITKIAKKFAKQNKLDEAEAIQLVANFFIEITQQQ